MVAPNGPPPDHPGAPRAAGLGPDGAAAVPQRTVVRDSSVSGRDVVAAAATEIRCGLGFGFGKGGHLSLA